MTFVPLALSKYTTHLYTGGCRKTMWRKRLCLTSKPSRAYNPTTWTTTLSFTYSVGCLPKKARPRIGRAIFVNFYLSIIPGHEKVKQASNRITQTKHLLRSLWRSFNMFLRPSTIKTCLLVLYPLDKSLWGFRHESRKLFKHEDAL